MYCIYCGRIFDFDGSYCCHECRIKISRINERIYLISLLLEAYPYIPNIKLRGKIEKVIPSLALE